MKSSFSFRFFLGPLFGALATLAPPRAAFARKCQADTDCPRGFKCDSSGQPDLPGFCYALECRSDADCAPALRCQPGGNECTPEPDGAEPCRAISTCGPEWQAPCAKDADCGPGFTCSGSSGYYQCGPGADAAVPPYAMSDRIPCADLPKPPMIPCETDASCPFRIPEICKAGSTCLSVTWNVCVQEPTPPCAVDSDCPSTWSCACPSYPSFGGPIPVGLDSGGPARSCTKECIPPNEDLTNNGFGPFVAGSADLGSSPALDGGAGESGPGVSDAGIRAGGKKASGEAASGGCSVGARTNDENTFGVVLAVGACALVGRRRRARPRAS